MTSELQPHFDGYPLVIKHGLLEIHHLVRSCCELNREFIVDFSHDFPICSYMFTIFSQIFPIPIFFLTFFPYLMVKNGLIKGPIAWHSKIDFSPGIAKEDTIPPSTVRSSQSGVFVFPWFLPVLVTLDFFSIRENLEPWILPLH